MTDRISVTLSITCASRGSRSQTFSPGTLEGMQPNSPRTSTGASGLGSNVSIWLGDPYMNSNMHDLAWPKLLDPGADVSALALTAIGVPEQPEPEHPQRADVEQGRGESGRRTAVSGLPGRESCGNLAR